jgi:cytochrome c'
MAKYILFAVALLLLGALLGNSAARYVQRQHQHTRAVMTLAQFHLDRLTAAAQSGQCASFGFERERLLRVYDELTQAFPRSLEQDQEFRKDADALRSALAETAAGNGCAAAAASAKAVRDACDDCHHEYR